MRDYMTFVDQNHHNNHEVVIIIKKKIYTPFHLFIHRFYPSVHCYSYLSLLYYYTYFVPFSPLYTVAAVFFYSLCTEEVLFYILYTLCVWRRRRLEQRYNKVMLSWVEFMWKWNINVNDTHLLQKNRSNGSS